MNKKKVVKKNKSKLGRYFFFAVISCYILIRLIPVVASSTNGTSIAEYGNIKVVNELDGYIIRNEQTINSVMEGSIKYLVRQGEKVEKNYDIVEISKDIVDNATRKKLEVINQRIASLNEDETSLFQSDVNKINSEVDDIINDIRIYTNKKDLLKVEDLKKELENKLQKKRTISGDKSFAGKNMEDLKVEQQQLENEINSSIKKIKSTNSGIISYYIDGYENILSPKNIEALELDKLSKINKEPVDVRTDHVIHNQPLFKIIDNQLLYIIACVDEKNAEHYKVGKTVTFNLPQGTVTGIIHNKIEKENKILVTFQLKEYTEDLLINRSLKLETVVVNYEGLQLYIDSIIEKEGRKGVYVLDINRNAVFKPIQIIGFNDESVIVKVNVFYEKVDGKTNTVETVKLYDEVVRNAENVEEGQIVF